MSLDIRPDHLKIVQEILERIIPDREVWAFGSRVNGTAKGTSDLDLVVIAENSLDFNTLGALRDAFSESDIPYKVDVVDWATVSETFREIIRKDKVVIQKGITKGLCDRDPQGRNFESMGCEWCHTTLGILTEWTSGGTPSKQEPSYWNGDIPWISASTMKTIRLENSELKITASGLEHGSRSAEARSVLLLVRGSELHKRIPIGIATRTLAFNQDVKALKARESLMPEYLLYWLLGNVETLLNKVEFTGIGAGKLDTDVLKNLPFHLPSIPEQRAIAHILGTLDDKIELNRRMNETLEAMAQALFKSWFVDFDPVRAKLEGRHTELPKEIEDLFPDSFEDSELGEIPRGWIPTTLGSVIEIWDSKRIPLSSRERADRKGKYPYYGAASVIDYVDGYLFNGTYILVGEDGSVINGDQTPITQYVWGQFWVSNHAHVLTGKNGISNEHLLLFLRLINISAFVTGAVQLKLNQASLNRIPIILSSKILCEKFGIIIDPLFKKFRKNTEEMACLSVFRDSLLPKLLSGKIRVKDSERFWERPL